ncbi:FAD dependent oxidoreductase [Macrophomina phaseolina MS6]|uniref:FAD dependent oxidoreductase n=1 Tax=Macrophomina phaseolina (strain MS6) TaxID=1126212 RepID=K2S2R7_MACPH|nr:FAD dependent oxidoreductase [Macrophomina phaseolina MS6]
MQRLALPHLLTLADAHPASSVRRIPIEDVRDDDAAATVEDVWYRTHVPDFEAIPASELPPGCTIGMRWGTVVLEPGILLPWLRARLEGDGVRFVEREVGSLKDVGEGVDVVINATGVGAKALAGDQAVKAVRGQTHLVRTWWEKVFMRQGSQYTYCIPRLDGTAILGGVKGYGSEDPGVKEDQRTDIFNRVGDNIPHVFAAFPADFDVVRDNVGFRPGREGGPRVEKEVIDGQKIVHAYGEWFGLSLFSYQQFTRVMQAFPAAATATALGLEKLSASWSMNFCPPRRKQSCKPTRMDTLKVSSMISKPCFISYCALENI